MRRRLANTWVGRVRARFGRSWCMYGGEAKEEMSNRESRANVWRKKKKEERESSGVRGSRSFLEPPSSSFFNPLIPNNYGPLIIIIQIPGLLILNRILNMIIGQFTCPLIILRFDSIHCRFNPKVRYTSRSEIYNCFNTQ